MCHGRAGTMSFVPLEQVPGAPLTVENFGRRGSAVSAGWHGWLVPVTQGSVTQFPCL